MKNTAGEEIETTFKKCNCNSTGGCEKCRPKIKLNMYKTYIKSPFEEYLDILNKLKN